MKRFDRDYFEEGKGSSYKKGYEYTQKTLEMYAILVLKALGKYKIEETKLKILDVGCAFGYFLRFFDNNGFETYGIDVSTYALQQSKKITKAKTLLCDIQAKLPFQDDFFDVITMFDVIEHLERPLDALKNVYRILRNYGVFFLSSPNANSFGRIVMREKWAGVTDKTHLFLLTPYSISLILKREGFHLLEVRTPQFYPFSKKWLKIVNNTPFGGSLWVVSRK